jgi:hypothetical protein
MLLLFSFAVLLLLFCRRSFVFVSISISIFAFAFASFCRHPERSEGPRRSKFTTTARTFQLTLLPPSLLPSSSSSATAYPAERGLSKLISLKTSIRS